jgi:hypothetical protein
MSFGVLTIVWQGIFIKDHPFRIGASHTVAATIRVFCDITDLTREVVHPSVTTEGASHFTIGDSAKRTSTIGGARSITCITFLMEIEFTITTFNKNFQERFRDTTPALVRGGSKNLQIIQNNIR